MKKIIIFFCLILFPGLLSAQYSGGNGRGDAFAESLSLPVGTKEVNGEANPEGMLKQIFPNPFCTKTTIEFTVTRQEKVYIAVYDITGCLILTVLDELMNPGNHTTSIDGTFLHGGLYCCRVSAGNYAQTKLMILVK